MKKTSLVVGVGLSTTFLMALGALQFKAPPAAGNDFDVPFRTGSKGPVGPGRPSMRTSVTTFRPAADRSGHHPLPRPPLPPPRPHPPPSALTPVSTLPQAITLDFSPLFLALVPIALFLGAAAALALATATRPNQAVATAQQQQQQSDSNNNANNANTAQLANSLLSSTGSNSAAPYIFAINSTAYGVVVGNTATPFFLFNVDGSGVTIGRSLKRWFDRWRFSFDDWT